MRKRGEKQGGEKRQRASLNEMEEWGDGRWRWRRVDDGLNEGGNQSSEEDYEISGYPISDVRGV